MSRKEEYKNNNGQYLIDLASNEDINALGGGVLYKVLESGEGKANGNSAQYSNLPLQGFSYQW